MCDGWCQAQRELFQTWKPSSSVEKGTTIASRRPQQKIIWFFFRSIKIFKKYCGILGSTKIFLCNFAMWQPSIKDDDCSWIDWNLYRKTSCWVLKLKVACPSRKLPQKNRNLPSDVPRIVMPLHGVRI